MTDENKTETEVETIDFEEKIEELEKELAQKDEEIEKLKDELKNTSDFHKDFKRILKISKKSQTKEIRI